MSKVIHLSDEAHHEAKEYCKVHGLRMSDWVAELIKTALARGNGPTAGIPLHGALPVTTHGKAEGNLSAPLSQCTPANHCQNTSAVSSLPSSLHSRSVGSGNSMLASGAVEITNSASRSVADQVITPIVWPREERSKAGVETATKRQPTSFGPKKKMLASYDETPETNDEGVPPYAAPPFWAKAK